MAAKVVLLVGTRHKGESRKAVQACNDYLRMGPGRSLYKLAAAYQATEPDQPAPPTTSLSTLKTWSADWRWAARVEAYDAQLEAEKTLRKQLALESGLALGYERVLALRELAGLLSEQLYERTEDGHLFNLWLADVKQIGSGDDAERVDLVRFNAPLIAQLRGVLEDLASETGGRQQRVEHSTKDGQPLPITFIQVGPAAEPDHDGDDDDPDTG